MILLSEWTFYILNSSFYFFNLEWMFLRKPFRDASSATRDPKRGETSLRRRAVPKTTVAAIRGPDHVFDCFDRASWKRERDMRVASRMGLDMWE